MGLFTMNKEKIFDYYSKNRGGINGALSGFLFSAFILIFGFFKSVFIALCVGLGYYIGKRLSNDKKYIKNLLDKILPPGTYR